MENRESGRADGATGAAPEAAVAELLKAVLEVAPAAVAVLDRRMHYLEVNARWRSEYGLGDRALIGQSHLEVFPDLPERWKQVYRRCLEGTSARSEAEPFKRTDGHIDWVRWDVRPWRYPDGRIGGIVIFSEIVTERVQAYESLRASEERLRTLIEQAGDGIVLLAQDGICLDVNPRALEMTGYAREDLLGSGIEKTVTPAHRAEVAPELSKAVAGQDYRIEWPVLRKDGSVFTGEVSTTLLRDGRVLMLLRDVTDRKRLEAALRANEEKYRAILETTSDAVLLADGTQTIVYANAAVSAIFGYEPGELVGRSLELLMPQRYRTRHAGIFGGRIADGPLVQRKKPAEFHGLRRDGSEFPVEVSLSEVSIDERRMFAGFIRDISDKKRAQEQMLRLQRVRTVLSSINNLIVHSRERRQLFEGCCRIAVEQGLFATAWIARLDGTAISAAAVCGDADHYVPERLQDALPAPEDGNAEPAGRALRRRQPAICNDIARLPASSLWRDAALQRGYLSAAAIPFTSSDGMVYCLCLYAGTRQFFSSDEMLALAELADDVAYALEFIRHEEHLEFLAYYDPLTRLPNRHGMLESLGDLIATHADVALVKLDIQNFRSVNESLGRQVGDQVLMALAQRLRELGGKAELIARTGVDRFALLLPDIADKAAIEALVEGELAALLSRPVIVEGKPVQLSFRIGITRFPEDSQEPETLAHHAEAALNRAKQGGEPYVFYSQTMASQLAERSGIQALLPAAIERQEFVLHYQPKVDLRSNAIVGAEALIRWQSPELGLVSPAKFIPLLEESGLIVPVGRWVLEQALRDYRAWQAQGLIPVPVAVNVSAAQLQRKDFVDGFRSLLADCAGDKPALEVEITESMLMSDLDGHINRLKALRALGVSVAIDDFGTGYSSLAYLARLPINTLKIDRSFVAAMIDSSDMMSVVSTILSLAHSLQLRVVAEGVETPEQLKFLRLLRCDQIQGWVFSKAVPAQDFAQLLREGRRLVVDAGEPEPVSRLTVF